MGVLYLNQYDCKWNSVTDKDVAKNNKWGGYCQKDGNFNERGDWVSGPLIKCKGLPCEYFELGE